MCVGFEYHGHPPAKELFTSASQQPDTGGELAEPSCAHCARVQPGSRAKAPAPAFPSNQKQQLPWRAKNDLPTCCLSPERCRAQVQMDAAPHSAQAPTWLLWLSAHGLLGALWQSLIDFTQNFQCLQVSACDLLALGLLLQSLHAKQNKIIRRLSLIFLNLQENFSWAQICCQMIFLLTCLFYSDKSSGSKIWKIIFKLTRKWGGDGWVTAEIFTNLKGFLYLEAGKKKEVRFQGC